MKWRGIACGVLLCAGAVHAQVLAPPFTLDVPVDGPASGRQSDPAVVLLGDTAFVTWADQRDGRGWDLWFRRLGLASGAGLTTFSEPLVRGAAQQQAPAAAAGASTVLVAWLDDAACASEVRAQRFSATGQPVGAVLSLSTGACTPDGPAVAWDDVSGQWLVTWGRHGAGREVHGALVRGDGTLAVPDFVIASAANTARAPRVSARPGGFLVAWADDRATFGTANVYAVPVDATGVVGAPTALSASAAAQDSPCVAPWGASGETLVTWVEGTSVRARALSSTGALLGAPFTVTTGTPIDVGCARAAAGTVVVLPVHARASGYGVFLHTVFSDAGVSAEYDVAPRFSYFSREQPELVFSGDRGLLVVRGPAGYVTSDDILARVVVLDGGLAVDAGAVFTLGTAGTGLGRPVAAFDGARYLAAWRDDGQSYAGADYFGSLLEAGTGRALLDGGVRFTSHSGSLVSFPSVAAAPTGSFFLAWGDDGSSGHLRGLRVAADGTPAMTSLLLSDVSSYVDEHASTWFGGGWATASSQGGGVRLRRTSLAGAPLLTETVMTSGDGANQQVDTAALADVLLTVFLRRDAGLDVLGVRYALDAGVLDPQGFTVGGGAGDQLDPSVAAGASLFLAAWRADGGIFSSRVTPAGAVLDQPPLVLAAPGTASLTPRVGWTGTNFLVAWQQDGDVRAARVSETGAVLDVPALVVAADAEAERRPFIAPGPAGETLLLWESFELPWGSFRLRGRFFADVASSPPDAGAADAGAADAGALDAGVADAGAADAGVADAGVADAGVSDAGAQLIDLDGGLEQGGDAGVTAPHRALAVGCGCQSADLLALVGLLPLLRRRRLSAAARS